MLGESKFFKNIEIAWARRANAIAIAYLHRITQGIMLLLDGIIHEKRIADSSDGQNFGSTRAIGDLHSCYT